MTITFNFPELERAIKARQGRYLPYVSKFLILNAYVPEGHDLSVVSVFITL